MLRTPFEWLEFALECLGCLLSGSNLLLNASNPFRMVRIQIRMLSIPFEWFEFAFECFESLLNGQIYNQMLRIPFEWLEFAFECIQSRSKA